MEEGQDGQGWLPPGAMRTSSSTCRGYPSRPCSKGSAAPPQVRRNSTCWKQAVGYDELLRLLRMAVWHCSGSWHFLHFAPTRETSKSMNVKQLRAFRQTGLCSAQNRLCPLPCTAPISRACISHNILGPRQVEFLLWGSTVAWDTPWKAIAGLSAHGDMGKRRSTTTGQLARTVYSHNC